MQSTTTRTSGKAILVGEHAVLYGAAAVAIPLPTMQFELTTKIGAEQKAHYLFGRKPVNEVVKKVIEAAATIFDLNPNNIELEAHSDIPIGAGLGSSAALCVALVRNFATQTQRHLDDEAACLAATELENHFHGESSGLDCAVVAHQKPILYRRAETAEVLDVQIPPGLLLIDSRKRCSTQDMIQKAAVFFKNHDKLADIFDQISQASVQALRNQDEELLADCLRDAHAHLAEVEVVGELGEIITACLKAGAKAAKITGAGGGGCILCYAPHDNSAVIEKLSRLPVDVYKMS